MLVATYTDSSAPTRGSALELCILLAAILLGTGALPTINVFVGGPLLPLITPLWLLLYLGSFLGLMFRFGINWISWLVRYRILLVLLLLGTVASVSWSINAQMSAERVVHLVGCSLIGVFIGFTIPLLVTLRIFAVVLAVIMVASVAAAVAIPGLGIESYEGTQVWKGVFNTKNDLGFWSGIGVLLYITLSESCHTLVLKLMCFMMAGVCLLTLALSHSATSLVAMVAAGFLALYFYIASRFQLSFFRMAFIAVLFAALTVLVIGNIETSELIGRSGDLTGRGEVWSQVTKLIFDNPLKGVGYGSLWFPTDETLWVQQSYFDFTWVVFHAHNGLLQVASEVGIPLALIALLMVTQQVIEIFYCQYERRQVGVLFVLAFVAAYLISNYSEARFLVTRELFWIFYLALPISMLRQMNVVSAQEPSTSRIDEGSAAQHRESYTSVHNKPWLEPLPNVQSPSHLALPAGSSSVEMVASTNDSDIDDVSINLESTSSSLSLTETDIDLGGLVEESSDVSSSAEILDATGADVAEHPPSADEREPETFENNDTYDVDRFDIDIDFDGTDEWVDIDLDDSK